MCEQRARAPGRTYALGSLAARPTLPHGGLARRRRPRRPGRRSRTCPTTSTPRRSRSSSRRRTTRRTATWRRTWRSSSPGRSAASPAPSPRRSPQSIAVDPAHVAAVEVAGPGFLNIRFASAHLTAGLADLLAPGRRLRPDGRPRRRDGHRRVRLGQPDRPADGRPRAQRGPGRHRRDAPGLDRLRRHARVLLQRRRPPDADAGPERPRPVPGRRPTRTRRPRRSTTGWSCPRASPTTATAATTSPRSPRRSPRRRATRSSDVGRRGPASRTPPATPSSPTSWARCAAWASDGLAFNERDLYAPRRGRAGAGLGRRRAAPRPRTWSTTRTARSGSRRARSARPSPRATAARRARTWSWSSRAASRPTGCPTSPTTSTSWRRADLVLDVFGADHIATYPDVLRGVRALAGDAAADRVDVVVYQFVTLVRGGQPVKMSTRKATYETLDDLMDEVTPDVTRFFFLMRAPGTHLEFDLDLAKEASEKNPVFYLQYAHARIASIERKAADTGLDATADADLDLLTHPSPRRRSSRRCSSSPTRSGRRPRPGPRTSWRRSCATSRRRSTRSTETAGSSARRRRWRRRACGWPRPPGPSWATGSPCSASTPPR